MTITRSCPDYRYQNPSASTVDYSPDTCTRKRLWKNVWRRTDGKTKRNKINYYEFQFMIVDEVITNNCLSNVLKQGQKSSDR